MCKWYSITIRSNISFLFSGAWATRRKPREEDHAVPIGDNKRATPSQPDNVPEEDFVALWEEIPPSEIPLDEKMAEGANAIGSYFWTLTYIWHTKYFLFSLSDKLVWRLRSCQTTQYYT